MTRSTYHHRPRTGFTLVEMLVSTALIIFVMTILVSVFTSGIGALRNLRGVGSLQDQLRNATTVLRRDLAAPHFGRETNTLHGPALSQQRLDLYDWTPPKEGFFRIYQGAPSLPEGIDADLNRSYVMDTPEWRQTYNANLQPSLQIQPTSQNPTNYRHHYLHFTVRLEPTAGQGTGRDRYFSTSSFAPLLGGTPAEKAFAQQAIPMSKPEYLASDGVFYSPWAEVAYFLRETDLRAGLASPSARYAGSNKLYTLYRRKRLIPDARPAITIDQNQIPTATALTTLTRDVSVYDSGSPNQRQTVLNTPGSVTAPYRRFGMWPLAGQRNAAQPQWAGLNCFVPTNTIQPRNADAPHSFKTLFEEFEANAQFRDAGGDDILLENVLSWDIKAVWDVPTDVRINRVAQGVPEPRPYAANPDYPFDDLPQTPVGYGNEAFRDVLRFGTEFPRVFDTWCGEDQKLDPNRPVVLAPYSAWNARYENGGNAGAAYVTIPLRVRIKAIQIRVRVWDVRTQQARQVTIVQDL